MSERPKAEAKPEAEADSIVAPYKIIVYRAIKYIPYMMQPKYDPYTLPLFLVVFKPLTKPYEVDREWYAYKGLDACRKKLVKSKMHVLTREIHAAKVHINAIVQSEEPDSILKLTDKVILHKYKVYVVQIGNTDEDRVRALHYIFKENKTRPFKHYLDYIDKLPVG